MRSLFSLIVVGSAMFFAPFVQAQGAANVPPGHISVTGTADMTKPPEIIRIYFKQYGKGADLEAAKTTLVAAEKKLLTKLSDFGAEVVLTNAGLMAPSQNLHQQARNITNMIRNRRAAQGDNSPPDKSNPSYIERFLTIDVRPKNKQKETMSLLADLQEKLRKDYQELSGMNDAMPKDDSNEANRAEMSGYYNTTALYSNDVRFQMAAKITREDRLKLYVEAMRRAKSLAQDLADAAEMKVGSIQTISSNFNSVYTNFNYASGGRVVTATGDTPKFPIALKEDGSETLAMRDVGNTYQGVQVEPLTFQISLSATFKLEPGK